MGSRGGWDGASPVITLGVLPDRCLQESLVSKVYELLKMKRDRRAPTEQALRETLLEYCLPFEDPPFTLEAVCPILFIYIEAHRLRYGRTVTLFSHIQTKVRVDGHQGKGGGVDISRMSKLDLLC